MQYIIMADGKATRWNNYKGIPKHLIEINGEVLLSHTVRLLKEGDPDGQIIITSHDSRYEFEGAVRYEPENNHLEIDRFTEELIADNICFLYGDTFYSEKSMNIILSKPVDDILFFGNRQSIVAIKIQDGELFRKHVHRVRELFLAGKIDECIGWQVYQSFTGLPFKENVIGNNFVTLEDDTEDFNSPEDYNRRVKK